jgi:hypothetical protein
MFFKNLDLSLGKLCFCSFSHMIDGKHLHLDTQQKTILIIFFTLSAIGISHFKHFFLYVNLRYARLA